MKLAKAALALSTLVPSVMADGHTEPTEYVSDVDLAISIAR